MCIQTKFYGGKKTRKRREEIKAQPSFSHRII